MTDALPPPVPAKSETQKKGRNCWVVGCSGCLIGIALLVIIGMVVTWQVKRAFMVEPFEPIEMTQTEEANAEAKLKALNLLESEGNAPEDFEIPEQGLVLSEDEMNYWISRMDNEFSDAVRLDFEPGEVTAEMRMGEGSGKRLSVMATLTVVQTEEDLDVRLIDLKLGKFSLPNSMKEEYRKENLALEAFSDPETKEAFQSRVEKIEILKDEILFVPKKK